MMIGGFSVKRAGETATKLQQEEYINKKALTKSLAIALTYWLTCCASYDLSFLDTSPNIRKYLKNYLSPQALKYPCTPQA